MSATSTRVELCRVSDVEVGTAIKVKTGDLVLAVYNVEGKIFVTDDASTHGPGSLSEGALKDDIIECNFHGGQFNVRTGKVMMSPCMEPEKTCKVTVEDDIVFIDV